MDGTVGAGFGLAIRGQLVDFPAGSRIVGADPAMVDAIEAASAEVTWDEVVPGEDGPVRRGPGRPRKA